MAKGDVAVRKKETIFDELEQLHEAVNRQAYSLFRNRGGLWGGPLTDWLRAEQDLIWKPAIELRQKSGQYEVLAATPGVEAKDLEVEITPEDMLIKADIHHTHTPEDGVVKVCEFTGGQLFRSVHFPERIDPDSATADYRNGMLRITASIAKPAGQKRVEITTG